MSYTAESQAAGRHILPDLTRAFAVLGIVLVNVAYFGGNAFLHLKRFSCPHLRIYVT